MSKPNFRAGETDRAENETARATRSRAVEALKAGDRAAAVAFARHAQLLHPDEAQLTNFEARNAFALNRTAEAHHGFRRTLVLRPDHLEAWRHRGIHAFMQLETDSAASAWRHALALDPGDFATLRNLFQAARRKGDWTIAERVGRRAMALRPHDDQAAFDLGMHYLSLHRWAEGWPLYDRRIHLPSAKPRPDRYALPYWDGKPAPDLRLLVWADQNVGDEMQFAQLLPDLLRDVGTVTLECDPRLVPVFGRSFPALRVVARADPPADPGPFDAQIPQGHLGRLYRPSDDRFEAAPRTWLLADPERAAALRQHYEELSGGRPVVGIAWKSANTVFQGKNVPVADWTPILQTAGAAFLSVQYGDVADDLATMRAGSGVDILHDPSIDALHDMDGFGAQLSAVDLVISISNSTIHQACGLGRPVWAMLHVRPDWRWGMAGADCPWFPSLRLYRQSVRFDWAPVAAAVARDLAEWVAGRRPA
jgi:tetratricopeptide (TPR) repeat protein